MFVKFNSCNLWLKGVPIFEDLQKEIKEKLTHPLFSIPPFGYSLSDLYYKVNRNNTLNRIISIDLF